MAEFLAGREKLFVVLDPVIAAKNGTRLVTDDGITAMKERLFPLTTCLTPNLEEARLLLGAGIDGIGSMEAAAQDLVHMGPQSVVLKGGHLPGDPVDLLFDGRETTRYEKKRIERVVHGTGCIFSSALLALVARPYPMKEAFLETEQIMEKLIMESARPGSDGYFYAFPGISASQAGMRWIVFRAMVDAASRLRELNMAEFIPEARMSLAYAVPQARTSLDVASFAGGIGLRRGRVHVNGNPEFGLSTQVSALCLSCMKYYPFVRSTAVVRCGPGIIERAQEKGLSIHRHKGKRFDPDRFIAPLAKERAESPPDIIYDPGDTGQEPLLWLFARDPEELITKMEMIRTCTIN